MKFNLFSKYERLKNQTPELKDLKDNLNYNSKITIFDKLSQSDLIDKLISKLQQLYHQITDKLFNRFDLKNELKQGKIYTIIMAAIIFLILILISTFFVIMLNSILGINLIFSMLKYSLFFIKWGYTILKSKGKLILKYLSNLFPNSKILKQSKNIKIENIPFFETTILNNIQELINKLESFDLDVNLEKEIILKLKSILGMLRLEDETFLNEIKSLEYKQKIIKRLNEISYEIDLLKKKSEEQKHFQEVKIELNERLDEEINRKVYKKM